MLRSSVPVGLEYVDYRQAFTVGLLICVAAGDVDVAGSC